MKLKHILFTLAFALLSVTTINAQEIEIKKVMGENTFLQNDQRLTFKQAQELMQTNQDALDMMNSAKSNRTCAMILGGAGGALIGFPIGTAISGGDAKWELAGAGALLVLGSIPIIKGYNTKVEKAVDIYNTNLPSVGYQFQPEFNLNVTGNGLGISMSF